MGNNIFCCHNRQDQSAIKSTTDSQQRQIYRGTIDVDQFASQRLTQPYQISILDQFQNHINSTYQDKKNIEDSLLSGVKILSNNKDDSGELNIIKIQYLDYICTIVYQQPLNYERLSNELLKYKQNGYLTTILQCFPFEEGNHFGYFLVQQNNELTSNSS
ncbi:hypothetical protein ABPG74_011150 [Tetrahymena malaccensis]